jgi:hypothetical protein
MEDRGYMKSAVDEIALTKEYHLTIISYSFSFLSDDIC